MDFVTGQTYLGDILRIVSDSLLAPVIVLLLAAIAYALFSVGGIIAEGFLERRDFKVNMPRFLADLMAAKQDEIPDIIKGSGLLNRQKIALLLVYDYRTLPGDSLVALVRRVIAKEDGHYKGIIARNNVVVRVAPMIGLMGTLIPLGPGIAAMGQGDLDALSSSLIIAFNTTVAGLAAASVCLVVARIHKSWYDDYMNALESAMATMVQKLEEMREAGEITVQEPTDYSFLFQASLKRQKKPQGTSQKQALDAADEAPAAEGQPAPEPPEPPAER